jgi:hypothetical protein
MVMMILDVSYLKVLSAAANEQTNTSSRVSVISIGTMLRAYKEVVINMIKSKAVMVFMNMVKRLCEK